MGCTANVNFIRLYPATINHHTEANHIERLAKKWIGEDHFSKVDLPLACSEDFSLFLEQRPGALFCLGTMKPGEPVKVLHTSTYDYNDNMIATGAYFYVRIVEDRLGIKVLQ